jgi:hypothetical protein
MDYADYGDFSDFADRRDVQMGTEIWKPKDVCQKKTGIGIANMQEAFVW